MRLLASYFYVSIHRYMQAFEDCWNFVLCAIFLLMLTALCSVAFAAITVQYLSLLTVLYESSRFLALHIRLSN
jgi:hypothetical protein